MSRVKIFCRQLLDRKSREEISSAVVIYEMALQGTEAPVNAFLQGELSACQEALQTFSLRGINSHEMLHCVGSVNSQEMKNGLRG